MTRDPTYSTEDIRALAEAGVTLTSELSVEAVLQRVADVAREQIGARYAALSVLSIGGSIEQFLSSGITAEERAAIGPIPHGRGLLGVLLHEGSSLRLKDMSKDTRSIGFPPNHPRMTSLLGVPVVWRGEIIGNLYLTDKQGAEEFDERDEDLLRLLSTWAAQAINNARLHQKLESLARLEERDRIGMDLHDGVIQSIYAVTLHLEDCADRLATEGDDVKPDIECAIDDLNKVIKDIRSYIFDLRPQLSHVDDLPKALIQLVEQFRVNNLTKTTLEIESPFRALGGEAEAMALFHIAQEALNNAGKHSKASAVAIRLHMTSEGLMLEVEDNGIGFEQPPEDVSGAHHGLRNMRDRARSVGGALSYASAHGEGTTVRVTLPPRERNYR
jgi:signal transduction histidine kinase